MARRHEDEEYEEEHEGNSLVRVLTDPAWRRTAMIPLILVLFAGGAFLMWRRYADEVLGHKTYALGRLQHRIHAAS